jgi:hypothetical protein
MNTRLSHPSDCPSQNGWLHHRRGALHRLSCAAVVLLCACEKPRPDVNTDAIPPLVSMNDDEKHSAQPDLATEGALLPAEDSLCAPTPRPTTAGSDVDPENARRDCPDDVPDAVGGDDIADDGEPALALAPVNPDSNGDGVPDTND